jgi:predicted NUDIX family phosphoesterase
MKTPSTKEKTMAKLALCIKRADAPQDVIDAFAGSNRMLLPIPASFWNTPVELVDRAICETDETWLQLLPYITANTDKVFMYTRGGAGEEARLHGNYSIGVGGHVDVAPSEDSDDGELLNVIRKEAAREIMEEIKIAVNPSELHPTYFICDPTNPVGRVHLGLVIAYMLPEDQAIDFVNGLEAGSIENARMVTGAELHSPEVYARLENWSQILADAFYVSEEDFPTDGGLRVASLEELEGNVSPDTEADADWDNPAAEVGGELIADAQAAGDAGEDEDDGMGICGECDELMEDCTCEFEGSDDTDGEDDPDPAVAAANREIEPVADRNSEEDYDL